MKEPGVKKKSAGAGETWAGAAILVVLAGIAGGLLLQQARYDPASAAPLSAAPGPSSESRAEAPFDLAACAPPELEAAGPAESFDADTLSDKIDGKADTYLPAGFQALFCRRFAVRDDPRSSVEAFVFDMGSPLNAYSVYSVQVRPEGEKLDLSQWATRTQNALYFTRGRYYVELVAGTSRSSLPEVARLFEGLRGPMKAFAENFVAAVPAETQEIRELALLPAEDRVGDSVRRTHADEFGVPGFDDVFRADYRLGGREAIAFLSVRKDAAEADRLAREYHRFYVKFGRDAGPLEDVPGGAAVEVEGVHKAVFAAGRVVAGVDQAPDAATAAALAARLHERLAKEKP